MSNFNIFLTTNIDAIMLVAVLNLIKAIVITQIEISIRFQK